MDAKCYSGGASFDSDLRRTGFNSLARTVRKLGLTTKDRLEIDYAVSSIGSLTADYLNILIQAAHGTSTHDQTRLKTKTSNSSKVKDHFRLYFPTLETVSNSRGGPNNAGSVCFREDWFQKTTFPKEVFRDHISTRSQLLSHNKIMLAHTPSKHISWAYMGSHNMSESAWGKIVRDSKRKENKLVCRNWECGVLLPVSKPDSSLLAEGAPIEPVSKVDAPLSELFRGYLDIPFEVPAPPHGDREPWFFQKERF
jgi:hypothetical protein